MSEKRGFALLDPRVHKEISASGGRTAHVMGNAHEWTKEEAQEAGRKGARTRQRLKREQQERSNE